MAAKWAQLPQWASGHQLAIQAIKPKQTFYQ